MRLRNLVTPIIAFLLFTIGCVPESLTTPLTIEERKLEFLPAYYDHVVYLDNQVVGFSYDGDEARNKRVSFSYEGDTQTTTFDPWKTPINPWTNRSCKRYDYDVVGLLPDGRLGLLITCDDESAATTYLSTNRFIFAYDWHTSKLEQLVKGKLTQGFDPTLYTWNPEMTLGVQATTGGYRGTIYWIMPDGISPMNVEIEDRGLAWNLMDYLEGKERTGIARNPAWSPDGKTIAFFVSIYGILEEPKPKFNVNYDLFFMDPTTKKPKIELMDIADAGKIVWSPNNEYLLFQGCVGRNLTCALWRYRISDKSLSLIKEGEFADYIWITNEKIVVAKNIELPYKDNEIWEYTIVE